jgi:hypothetical protein
MPSLPQVATALQDVLTTTAETAARATGCVRRTRRFTGATLVQTFVFGCLATPEPSLTDLSQMAATLGAPVSPQAIAQHCTRATAACLQQVLAAAVRTLVSADPVALPVLERFPAVEVLDTSTLSLPAALAATWPGCGNGRGPTAAAALKLGVRLDLVQGTLTGPLLDSGRTDDRGCAITAAPLLPGALRIADLGFWSVATLRELDRAGVLWLTRLQGQTGVLDAAGQPLDLDGLLATTPDDTLEREVRLGVTAQVPARLLAARVPPEVADRRRQRRKDEGKRRGTHPCQTSLARCDWLLLVTNVPADRLSRAEAVVLLRARWQIELLFKLWKQHGHIDEVRSADPWRVLTEVYAKLVAMVIQHWTLLLGCWQFGDRSLVKAAAVVRRYALPLALALGQIRRLRAMLATVQTCLERCGRLTRRRKRPSLYQLLLACDHDPALA